MRFKFLIGSAAALILASGGQLSAETHSLPSVAPAATSVVMPAQDAQPPQIDVNITQTDRVVWYASPIWIAVGVLAIVVVALIIGMAARGGGGGSTIVK